MADLTESANEHLIRARLQARLTEESDEISAAFEAHSLVGEACLKLTVAKALSMLSASTPVRHDFERQLLLSNSIGSWATVLKHIWNSDGLRQDSRLAEQLSPRTKRPNAYSDWASRVDSELLQAAQAAVPEHSWDDQGRATLLKIFGRFVTFRNKTRGHGAVRLSAKCESLPHLKAFTSRLLEDLEVFQEPAFYIERLTRDRVHVRPVLRTHSREGGDSPKISGFYFEDAGRLQPTPLIEADSDLSDFFLANGPTSGLRSEYLSYSSGRRRYGSISDWSTSRLNLPVSETAASKSLDLNDADRVFHNVPAFQSGSYIERPTLQEKFKDKLAREHVEIICLHGRGGIGKTSVALKVINEIKTDDARFDFIFWASSRTVDLTDHGPRDVRPDLLTEVECGESFSNFTEECGFPNEQNAEPGHVSRQTTHSIEKWMQSDGAGTTLFVFDNFETLRDPKAFFEWIRQHIRRPSVAVLTSRERDWHGADIIEVGGMELAEARTLIEQETTRLQLADRMTQKLREEVLTASDGHPFVIKLVMAHLSRNPTAKSPDHIIRKSTQSLDALFQSSFKSLSDLAKRALLDIAKVTSQVPKIALHAALKEREKNSSAIESALQELNVFSLVEIDTDAEGTEYLRIPLAAREYVKKEERTYAASSWSDDDAARLKLLGPVPDSLDRHSLSLNLESMLYSRGTSGSALPLKPAERRFAENIAEQYAMGWFLLGDSTMRSGVKTPQTLASAKADLERFIQEVPEGSFTCKAWSLLMRVAHDVDDRLLQLNAAIRRSQLSASSLSQLSNACDLFNEHAPRVYAGDLPVKRELASLLLNCTKRFEGQTGATDCSRFAWLSLHADDAQKAISFVDTGLALNPVHPHLLNLTKQSFYTSK